MGVIYLKDKPEVESFSYAYVEDAEGKLVRVALKSMKKVLGLLDPIETEITLLADGWTLSENGAYYVQPVRIEGTTKNSRVELLATPDQIIQLMNEELTLFIGNASGDIMAHCVNGTPNEDMTFEIKITEVV